MFRIKFLILILISIVSSQKLNGSIADLNYNNKKEEIEPSLQVILIIHPYNKINELPFFLSGIEKQNYPKDRINILIQTEIFNSVNNGQYEKSGERFKLNDKTIRILKSWKKSVELEYHEFELKIHQLNDDEDDQLSNDYWTFERYKKLMDLKLYGFNYALNSWASYCLLQDSDIILTNPNTFRNMLINFESTDENKEKKLILSPMLLSLSLYSNFWAGVNEDGYYKRTEDYLPILERRKIGSFKVPMVHSIVFINLSAKKSRELKFRYQDLKLEKLPYDDMIVFARSAESLNLSMYIDNREVYGFLMPSIDKFNLDANKKNLIDLELESLVETNSLFDILPSLEQFDYRLVDESRKISSKIDKIFVINLERREKRRIYMMQACELLNLHCEFVKAVDGKKIDKQYLIENKIQAMKKYLDPYHKRPLTYGEIGCFMSHYNIWLDVVRNNYSWTVVFEDDVRFNKDFHNRFNQLIHSVLDANVDFIYLGRKKEEKSAEEKWFNNFTVYPAYSYWTIGYLITLNGAKKLVNNQPLEKMIPVDEYLPIMYDKHPNLDWVKHFENRNLIALSAHPVLIQPLHYVGEANYISDTEDSTKIALNPHDEF